MSPRPIPEPIAPGQESVWDYPQPPAIRANDEEIIVILGGVEICETRASWHILETGHPPTYYLPRSAFIDGSLRPARGSSFCEWKGRASYLDVISGSEVAPRGAWYYPHPNADYSVIVDHVAVCMPVRWTSAWSMASEWCRSPVTTTAGGSHRM